MIAKTRTSSQSLLFASDTHYSRVIVATASSALIVLAILSWPNVLARLATADGSINSELQRIALSVVSIVLLVTGSILALYGCFWRPVIRLQHVLFHTLAGAALAFISCLIVIGSIMFRNSNIDPADELADASRLTALINVARRDGGEQAAWAEIARWYSERSQFSVIPHFDVWSMPNREQEDALHCIVAGNLGCVVSNPKSVPWRPGQPLEFRSPPLPPDVLFDLQRQTFILELLAFRFDDDPDGVLEFSQGFVEAWRQDNLPWPALREYSWGDDPMANRIQAQMALMSARRQHGDVLVADEIAFLRSLLHHADRLMDDDQHNFVTNHGMMQNTALLDIAIQYPEFDRGGMWQKTAVDRMWRHVEEHVGNDGVFLELTPGYHLYALKAFLYFRQQASAVGISIPSHVDSKLKSMTRFATEILQPDHTFPLIADTKESKIDVSNWPWLRLPDWSELAELKRVATDQQLLPNRPGARLWPDSGYFMLRTGSPAWNLQESMTLSFMLGQESHAHWHADKLSVTWYGAGRPLLQGPGYPSYHDIPERLRLIGTQSQNAVSVDGVSQTRGDVLNTISIPAAITNGIHAADHIKDLIAIQGLSQLYEGVIQRRTIVYGSQMGEFLIIDELDSGLPHTYRQHFRPANGLSGLGGPGEIRLVPDHNDNAVALIESWAIVNDRLIRPSSGGDRGTLEFRVNADRAIFITRLRINSTSNDKDTLKVAANQLSWKGDLGHLEIDLPVRSSLDFSWRPAL